MESERPSYVSVIDPVTSAIDRARMMLFEPFELTKWFVIGFCAFLANLGTGGGGGGGGSPRGGSGGGPPNFGQAEYAMNQAKDYVLANLSWIVPLVIIGFLLVITLILVFAWLSSRGRFMFLHCVALNKAQVVFPWKQYREHANSLFLFRVALGFIGFFVIFIPIILTVFLIIISLSTQHFTAEDIYSLIFLGLGILIFSISLAVISKFTNDFVVPIMYLRTISVRAAWREFMQILSMNKARFFLYLIFHFLISLVIGIMLLAIGFCTCCCAFCLFRIPYIGTLVLLPIHIFKRSYSLYYLQQYGRQFDVFPNEPENFQPQFSENPY